MAGLALRTLQSAVAAPPGTNPRVPTGTSTTPSATTTRNMGNVYGQPTQAELDALRAREMQELELKRRQEELKRAQSAPTPGELYQRELEAQSQAERERYDAARGVGPGPSGGVAGYSSSSGGSAASVGGTGGGGSAALTAYERELQNQELRLAKANADAAEAAARAAQNRPSVTEVMNMVNAAVPAPQPLPSVSAPRPAPSTASYAQLHDTQALRNAGALRTLEAQLEGSGLLDNVGLRSRMTKDIIASGSQALTDAERQMLEDELARQDEFAQAGYQGALSQRGQNLSTQQLATSAQQSKLNALLEALRGGSPLY